MNKYLLDTDIVVFLLRKRCGIAERVSKLNPSQLFVSEVTVAELEYGCYCSGRYEENRYMMDKFLSLVNIVPFADAVSLYAKEKFRLRTLGTSITDLDLFIACTSVANGLIMVTNNQKHFARVDNIVIENWVD